MVVFKKFFLVVIIFGFSLLLVSALKDNSAKQVLNSTDNFLMQAVFFGVGLILFVLLALIVKVFYQRYFT